MEKVVIYFDQPIRIKCDDKCNKSWGINNRPKMQLDKNDEDDYYFLSDDELGEAPADPGTYEGCHAKPRSESDKGNKWCIRECERCARSKTGESDLPLVLEDFGKRVFNIPDKHKL